jgi:DNA polymerase V
MYAMVDCNNFYASCERVFNPTLADKPVIVLSNNDGCAIARSDEAKALGIEMGSPYFMIEEFVRSHGVKVFSSNYTLYGDMSARVMETLAAFVPRLEMYSIDEAFLDMHNMPYHTLEKLGKKIKATVTQHTGIPVSIGIACTKTLAKLANRFAKKTKKQIGVHVIDSDQKRNEVLSYTQIGDVWGIGRQYANMLQRNNVHTAAEFVALPDDFVRAHMSVVGLRTLYELRGIPAIEWEFVPPPRKNTTTGRSFGKILTDKAQIEEAVSNYAANVAFKLRRDNTCAQEMTVFLHTNPFRTEDRQGNFAVHVQLSTATNATGDIIQYALKGLNLIYRPGFNFHKAGVTITKIVPETVVQANLFETDTNVEKKRKLMHSFDAVNRSFGRDVVRFSKQGYERKWKLRAEHLSKRYTTNFNELLTIKI